MVTLGRTVCMSGIRRTQPSDTLVVCWRVRSSVRYGAPYAEQVEWRVDIDGDDSGPVVFGRTTRKQLVRPNFSDQPSRLPGITDGGMGRFYGYRKVFEMSELPTGTLIVSATAYGRDGSHRVMEPVVIYNDRDGVDRRPSTKETYVDADTGNDANSGADWANAVRTMDQAIYLSQANPGGTSSADRDCGGAVIHARGAHIGGGSSGSDTRPWHCSGAWWLHIIAHDGMSWTRPNPPWGEAGDLVNMYGNGPGTHTRLRVTGCYWPGTGPNGYIGPGVLPEVWREGGVSGSKFWLGDGKASVRWADDDGLPFQFFAASIPDQLKGRVYVTGEYRRGCIWGYSQLETFTFDCEVEGWLGNPWFIVGAGRPAMHTCNIGHFYRGGAGPGKLEGYVRHNGGTQFEVQLMGGGVARLLGPVGGYDFGRDCAGMIGSVRWSVGMNGFPQPQNNGAWEVLATGTTGGRSWVEFANAAAVAGFGSVASYIETTQRAPWGVQPYDDVVHSNGFSIGPDSIGDDIMADMALWDVGPEAVGQALFLNGLDAGQHPRLLVENLHCDGRNRQWNCAQVHLVDAIMANCTATGSLWLSSFVFGSPPNFAGSEIVNCAFADSTDQAVEFVGAGWMDSCNFAVHPVGTNATTTSPWLASDPLVAPYSWAPAPGNYGTGNVLCDEPPEWAWDPAHPTRGVLRNVALHDWSIPGAPAGVVVEAVECLVTLAAANPVVVRGPVTVTTAPSSVTLATVDPGVIVAGIAAEGEPSSVTMSTDDPVVVRGPVTTTGVEQIQLTGNKFVVAVLGPVSTTCAASAVTLDTAGPVVAIGGPVIETPVQTWFPSRQPPGGPTRRWWLADFWRR